MAEAINISDGDILDLRREAAIHDRSIAAQAEYWMRLGREVERNPEMSSARVELALRGLIDPSDLMTGDEQEQFFDRLGEFMDRPSATKDAFYAEMKSRYEGLVLDEDENVIAVNRIAKKG